MSHDHHLQHHPHHGHSTTKQTPAQANREYYSSPDQIYLRERAFFEKFAADWTKEFLSLEPWLDLNYGSSTSNTNTSREKLRILDYAPGPGMVSFAALQLKPFVDGHEARFEKVIGVDIADGMVDLFNERVATARKSGEVKENVEIKAYRGDLISPTDEADIGKSDGKAPELDLKDEIFLPGPQGGGFDLITCSLAVHHFPDPGFAIKQLASRLRKDGLLLICDILPTTDGVSAADKHGHHENGSHGHVHHHNHSNQPGFESDVHASTVPHQHGFTAAELEDFFRNAGLIEVKSRAMDLEIVMPESLGGATRNMCLVIGRSSS